MSLRTCLLLVGGCVCMASALQSTLNTGLGINANPLGGASGGISPSFSELFTNLFGTSPQLNQLTNLVSGVTGTTGTCNILQMSTTTQAFKQTLAISSSHCQTAAKPGLHATCKETNVADTIKRIPSDTYNCVRNQIPTAVAETTRVCLQREQTRDLKNPNTVPNPYSWQDLTPIVTNYAVYYTKYSLQPADASKCYLQILHEQNDCRNVRDMMCAFAAGQSFDCVAPYQLVRQSKTDADTDDCQVVSLRLVQQNAQPTTTTTTTTTTPKPAKG